MLREEKNKKKKKEIIFFLFLRDFVGYNAGCFEQTPYI